MIYYFQTLSLKTRFLGVLLSFFSVLGFWWLLTGAPWALAHLKVLTQGGGLPNYSLGSLPKNLQDIFTVWGDEARRLYLTILAPSELGFWVALGAFLALSILYLLKKSNPPARWYLLPLLPLAALSCAVLEEALAVIASLMPPLETDLVALAATIFGAFRWVLFGLSMSVLVVGTVLTLVFKGLQKFTAPADPKDTPDSDRR